MEATRQQPVATDVTSIFITGPLMNSEEKATLKNSTRQIIDAGAWIRRTRFVLAVILFFLAADILVRWIFRMRAERGMPGADQEQQFTKSYGGESSI